LADAAHALVCVEGWSPLGYARLADLARERFGRSGRWVRELAVLGETLAQVPALRAAVIGADGEPPLARVAALTIARAGPRHAIPHWIAFARRVTVRELIAAVRADRAGDDSVLHDGECVSDDGAVAPGDRRVDREPDEEDDDAVTDLVRMAVPRWMRACFAECLDLHRAVSGYEAPVASFIEALAAEATAGGCPPDVVQQPMRTGIPVAVAESALARVNKRWDALRRSTQDVAVSMMQSDLRDSSIQGDEGCAAAGAAARGDRGVTEGAELFGVDLATARANPSRRERVAGEAARRLRLLVQAEDRIERELGDLLATMARHGDWTTLGFASAAHYASERLGMPRRTAESRVAVSNAVRRFKHVSDAYRSGRIGLEAAALVCRILAPGSSTAVQQRWIEHAARTTIKRLRDETRIFETDELDREVEPNGSGVGAPDRDNAFPRRPATDAEWHDSLDRPPGRTRGKLARCMPAWDWTTPTSDLAMADVFLTFRLPREVAGLFLSAVEFERRRLTARAEQSCGEAGAVADDTAPPRLRTPNQPASLQVARLYVDRCRRVPGWVGLLALLEDYAKTWDDPAAFPKRTWSRTYERANWRCMAPGCTSRRWQDDHHIRYRSAGGSDAAWNQLCLCRFHHLQGEHGRFARVRGRAPIDIVWRLGTKALARWYRNEMRLGDITEP
jgi:hypothetical protein